VIVLEKQGGSDAARIGYPVAVRRRSQHGAADNLTMAIHLQRRYCRLDYLESDAEPLGQLTPGQLPGKMKCLQDELDHQVETQPGLFQ
jgi:hypothetical protein